MKRMLSQKDREDIKEMIHEEVREVVQFLGNLIEPIAQDVAKLKEDVAVLKEDVAVLKEDVSALKDDVNRIRITMNEQNLMIIRRVQDMEENAFSHNKKDKK